MTEKQVSATLVGKLMTEVIEPPGGDVVPFSPPNVELKEEDKAGKIWARATIISGTSTVASFGAQNKLFRGTAILIVQIFGPLGDGDGEILALADKVVASFRASSITGGLRLYSPYITTVGKTPDNWWQVNVTCPFQNDDYA